MKPEWDILDYLYTRTSRRRELMISIMATWAICSTVIPNKSPVLRSEALSIPRNAWTIPFSTMNLFILAFVLLRFDSNIVTFLLLASICLRFYSCFLSISMTIDCERLLPLCDFICAIASTVYRKMLWRFVYTIEKVPISLYMNTVHILFTYVLTLQTSVLETTLVNIFVHIGTYLF